MMTKHATDQSYAVIEKVMNYKSNGMLLIYWMQYRSRLLELGEDGVKPDPGAVKYCIKACSVIEQLLRKRGLEIVWGDRLYQVEAIPDKDGNRPF